MLLLISIGIVLVNNSGNKENTNQVVNKDIKQKEINTTNEIILEKDISSNKILVEEKVAEIKAKNETTKEHEKPKNIIQEVLAIAQGKTIKKDQIVDTVLNTNVATKLSFEAENVNAVVLEIEKLKASNTVVTDAEIDSLLSLAEKDILKDRLTKNSSSTVNAEDLLNEVEQELDQSFRDKVFKSLQERYQKVKTAVADRNN